MNSKRKIYAKGLHALVCGAYIDFYSWGLLQKDEQRPNNAFLQSCFSSLSRSFPLQVANLFDDTQGVLSIKKYLKELQKSHLEKDKKLLKNINGLLKKNEDKLSRLRKKRGNDLAHTNLEIVEDILNGTPKENRSRKAKESYVTNKEIIELLLLGEKIVKAIVVHEMNKSVDPQNEILPIIQQDFVKIIKIDP
jgi:ERCC4-related helicase